DAEWHCVVLGASIALIRLLDVDMRGERLREKIEENLARQSQPEFFAIHLVREAGDFTAAMPPFVTAFLETQLSK
ncbi:MAG TPA: NUDIX hydrolase, partial [Bradyrhizobium sp.]|nr:NUDIX hydrolase [Bradyrhizobium sp.]